MFSTGGDRMVLASPETGPYMPPLAGDRTFLWRKEGPKRLDFHQKIEYGPGFNRIVQDL